jgi:hypothetical protein
MPHKHPRIVGNHQQRNSRPYHTRNKRNQPNARQLMHTCRCCSVSPCRHVLTHYIHTSNSTKKAIYTPTPGLAETLLRKHQPDLEATTICHLDNKQRNVRSTKTKWVPFQDNEDTSAYPEPDHTRSHACFLTEMEPKNIVYSDQTGRLLHPSSTGNNYILIAYNYDSNSILLRPYKNKTAPVLTTSIADIHQTLMKGGCKLLYHRLDNECPADLKEYFKQNNIQYQLAPPHDHRTIAAERAI